MEKEKATEVKCSTCSQSKKVKNAQLGVFIFGGIFFFFGVYGIVSFIKDLISMF